MPITQAELGRRVRGARRACRLTQEQVAEHLGFSRPSVAQIEAGNRAVSSLELDALAHLFGRDIREFVADEFEQADSLAALFRAQPQVAAEPEVAGALRDCVALGREINNLERLIGIEGEAAATAAYPLPAPTNRWEAIRQGERLASEERRRLGLGDTALPDLVELLETQGIRTGVVDLPEDVSGLTLNDPKAGLFVIANRDQHVLRRRFSFAHEYAHVLADRDRFGLVSRSSERSNLVEVRANAFAAAILMPEDGVRNYVAALGKGKPSRLYGEVFGDVLDEDESLDVEGRTTPGSQAVQLYDVVRLAHHFGVSRLATLYRLLNLKIISKPEFDRLKELDDLGRGKQLAEHLGLPEADHAEVRERFQHRILGLALEAFRREEISRGKLDELVVMLAIPHERLEALLEHAGLSEGDGTGVQNIATLEQCVDALEKLIDACLVRVRNLFFDIENPQHVAAVSLLGTVLELAQDLLPLLKKRSRAAPKVILRSLLEAYVDLRNVTSDSDYWRHMQLAQLEQQERLVRESKRPNATTNPYFISFLTNRKDSEERAAEIDEEKRALVDAGYKALKIRDRFERAGELDRYTTVYHLLCQESHHSLSALERRHLAGGAERREIAYFKHEDVTHLLSEADAAAGCIAIAVADVSLLLDGEVRDIESVGDQLEGFRSAMRPLLAHAAAAEEP